MKTCFMLSFHREKERDGHPYIFFIVDLNEKWTHFRLNLYRKLLPASLIIEQPVNWWITPQMNFRIIEEGPVIFEADFLLLVQLLSALFKLVAIS